VGAFAGNTAIAIRAYAYIRLLGKEGLMRVARHAVLAARYLAARLAPHFPLAYDGPCMHEFVAKPSAAILSAGVKTVMIAKRLIDFGFHPPTVYFPLIVDEALMVEPTETEPKERLDAFAEAMRSIAAEALADPDRLKDAPFEASVGRVDEVKAARELVLTHDLAKKR
jgi:glycine dehydrogenase subunit 2